MHLVITAVQTAVQIWCVFYIVCNKTESSVETVHKVWVTCSYCVAQKLQTSKMAARGGVPLPESPVKKSYPFEVVLLLQGSANTAFVQLCVARSTCLTVAWTKWLVACCTVLHQHVSNNPLKGCPFLSPRLCPLHYTKYTKHTESILKECRAACQTIWSPCETSCPIGHPKQSSHECASQWEWINCLGCPNKFGVEFFT